MCVQFATRADIASVGKLVINMLEPAVSTRSTTRRCPEHCSDGHGPKTGQAGLKGHFCCSFVSIVVNVCLGMYTDVDAFVLVPDCSVAGIQESAKK